MPPKSRKAAKKAAGKYAPKKSKPRVNPAKGSLSDSQVAALFESDRQLKIVLDSATIGIWDWNVLTNKTTWSGKIFEIFQYSTEDFNKASERYLELVHPEDRHLIMETIKHSLEQSAQHYLEHRIIRPDGQIRWIEVHGKGVKNSAGQIVRMHGTIVDITNRKNLESEREDWKTRHELISRSAGLIIYDYNIDSGNIAWSGNCEDVLGYKASELGDISRWAELIHPEDRTHAYTALEYAQAHVKPYEVYYRFRKNDGKYVYMHDKGFFVAGPTNEAERMLGVMNDVTSRFEVEASLRESEHRFRILQEASFGGIGLHDKGKILDCNQGLCNITGYSYEELIGKNGLELIAPEWRDFVYEKIISGYDQTYDVEGLRKDGSKYFLEIRGKNLPMEGKTIRVTEFRDITNRKINEEKIEQQNKKLLSAAEELRRKNHQLQEFTQIVSHNLRSPVGNILTLLNFYENATSEDEKREYVALLKESSVTTLTMLNELNDVLKIKQDKNIPKQDIQFEKMLHQVTSMLTARITEVGAQITFNFSKAETIHYPAIYLESILLNLVDNALKYHHPDRPAEISLESYYDDEQNLILAVRDNGLGINLERYGHQIFKLRKTFHYHPESRGIGLFMIKNQIEAMGGQITVESVENKGTTFYVNFNKSDKHG